MLTYDFEKPLVVVEEKIKKLRETMTKDNNPEIVQELADSEAEFKKTKKALYSNLTAWQKIQISRHPDRPKALDYISHIFTDFIELHGDRHIRDDKSLVGGFAFLDNKTVMVIGQEKGKTIKEKQFRNFGMNSPEGYKKSARLMRLAEKFGKPVICFIDTPGASPGLESERHGLAEAIAQNIRQMLSLKVPVISVIIGEGSSAGALALAVSDSILMMEFTWFSVITPESCSWILWHDWEHNEKAAEAMRLTAKDLCKLGMIDEFIKEPIGGAHHNPEACYKAVKEFIISYLVELEKLDPQERIDHRLERFIKIGNFKEK